MDEAVTFSVKTTKNRDGAVEYATVHGSDDATHGTWRTEGVAKVSASFLNAEHAGGRVAQGTCRHGSACDHERIHVPLREFTEAHRVVLCETHAGMLNTARGSLA